MEEDNFDFSLLPIAMKVASQTIGFDLVSVKPMISGLNSEELERIKNDTFVENRNAKLDSILYGSRYKEKKIEDHPDYRPGRPIGEIFYLDFKYGTESSI